MRKFCFGKIYPEIEVLTTFQDIENFEIRKASIGKTYPVKIIGCEKISTFSPECLNVENDYGIILKDQYGNIKQAYFLNPAQFKVTNDNVYINAYTYGGSKGVLKAWKNYFYDGVKEYNLWKNLKPAERQGWLELALRCQNIDYENPKTIIEIDGSDIKCYNDFYCTLGEALHGPGGYFGRNLNALVDCICSPEFGGGKLQKVIWKNSKRCRWKLKRKFKMIIDLFHEFRIEVELQ